MSCVWELVRVHRSNKRDFPFLSKLTAFHVGCFNYSCPRGFCYFHLSKLVIFKCMYFGWSLSLNFFLPSFSKHFFSISYSFLTLNIHLWLYFSFLLNQLISFSRSLLTIYLFSRFQSLSFIPLSHQSLFLFLSLISLFLLFLSHFFIPLLQSHFFSLGLTYFLSLPLYQSLSNNYGVVDCCIKIGCIERQSF